MKHISIGGLDVSRNHQRLCGLLNFHHRDAA
jgi:hypothetical protein